MNTEVVRLKSSISAQDDSITARSIAGNRYIEVFIFLGFWF